MANRLLPTGEALGRSPTTGEAKGKREIKEKFRILYIELRDRLMVGHRPLEAIIMVRIHVPQLCI